MEGLVGSALGFNFIVTYRLGPKILNPQYKISLIQICVSINALMFSQKELKKYVMLWFKNIPLGKLFVYDY